MEVCERDPGDKAPSWATPPPPPPDVVVAEVTAVVAVTEPPEGLSEGLWAERPDAPKVNEDWVPVVGWLPLVNNCNQTKAIKLISFHVAHVNANK